MSLSALKYSAVNTKARVLFGKLLSKNDYMNLLNSKSVPDVAAYLKKNTIYRNILADIDESQVHRGDLEKLFRTSLYGDFVKMLRFLRGKPRKFLEFAFMRYEFEDLKTLLSVIYTGRGIEAAIDSLVFLRKYSNLGYDSLVNSKSISSFIQALKGSIYYKVLSPFLDGSKTPSIFDMEMSLDLHFFMTVLKAKDKLLSGDDLENVTQSFGSEVDILNLLMIYRCKKLFNMSKENIIKYIIPYWYRLTREQLIQLSESKDMDEFKTHIQKTKYANIFKPDEEHMWETNAANYKYTMYKRFLRRENFNIGTTIAYLHLKELDIKNIITLTEGIRYSLPRDEIYSYLVGINK